MFYFLISESRIFEKFNFLFNFLLLLVFGFYFAILNCLNQLIFNKYGCNCYICLILNIQIVD
jgi:hypothetical protein